MKNKHSSTTARGGRRPTQGEGSIELSRAILRWANRGLPRIDFLSETSKALLDFSGCDAVEVRLSDGDLHYRWEATRRRACLERLRRRLQLPRLADRDSRA